MKMKSTILIVALATGMNYSFAQTGNGNGNQGIGTNQWKTNGNNADSTQFLGTNNYTSLRFKSNNTEYLRLTPDGKFGFGLINPTERFDIFGNVKLSGDVIFDGYKDLSDTNERFVFIDKDGRTGVRSQGGLKSIIYSTDCFLMGIDGSLGQLNYSPAWQSQSNGTIFTGVTCPAKLESEPTQQHMLCMFPGRGILQVLLELVLYRYHSICYP